MFFCNTNAVSKKLMLKGIFSSNGDGCLILYKL